jgi:hypothetical protein
MAYKYYSPYLKIGTKVQSRYRARWYGVVEQICESSYYKGKHCNHIVICRITHDHNGIPMRKTFLSMHLSTYWLRVIEEK